MREIKFRGWNGKEIFNIAVMAISACTWDCPDYGKRGVSLAYQPSIQVMQYTGLKDENGMEIYEGDILQFSGRVVACGIVKYNENLCCFQACHKMSCWLICKESEVKVEIIGNIYENPELLEGV